MDKITSTVLQQLCNYNIPHECITPDTFVNFVFENLQGKSCCLYKKGIHTFSSNCYERLYLLSAVQACFEYSFDKRLISNRDQTSNTKMSNAPTHEIQQDVDSCDLSLNHSIGDKSFDKRRQQEASKFDCFEKWYRQASHMLADNSFIFQLLTFQEQSQCFFVSHMINKVICTCVSQHDKISIILRYIEDKWKKTKNIGDNELNFVNFFMSKRQCGDQNFIREQVFNWFIDEIPLSLKSSFVQRLKDSKCKSFHENLLTLSVLGKALKYSVFCGKDIPTCVISVALDILTSHKDIFFSSALLKHSMGQAMFLKFLKALNNLIHIKFCFKKANTSDIILNACVKILQNFSSLFEMCETKRYMTPMMFWESKELEDNRKQHENWASFNLNVVVAREMFLLVVKTSATLSCAGYPLNGHGTTSITDEWERFELWMTKHYENQLLISGWIPALLGDQDDKWITVLFCLLHIYQNSTEKEHITSVEKEQITSAKVEHITPAYKEQITSPDKEQMTTADKEHITTAKTEYVITSNVFLNSICPHRLFIQFVEFICFDHLVFSDFLMSPETIFLEYLTKYLAYLKDNWDTFVTCCHKQSECFDVAEHHSGLHSNDLKSDGNLMNAEQSKHEELYFPKESSSLSPEQPTTLKRQNCDVLKCSPHYKLVKIYKPIGHLVPYADSESSDEETVDNNKYSSPADNEDKSKLRCELNLNSVNKTEFSITDNEVIDRNVILTTNNMLDCKIILSSASSSFDDECNVEVGQSESYHNGEMANEIEEESYSKDTLERVMTMLIRLRFHIERLDSHQLIPYQSNLLLNLLSSSEDKYENMT